LADENFSTYFERPTLDEIRSYELTDIMGKPAFLRGRFFSLKKWISHNPENFRTSDQNGFYFCGDKYLGGKTEIIFFNLKFWGKKRPTRKESTI